MARWLLLVAALLTADDRPVAETSLEMPASVAELLATGTWDEGTPKGFRIIALSFIADGCVGRQRAEPTRRGLAVHCVDRAVKLARGLVPRVHGEHTIRLAHLALILGSRDALGECADPELHRAVVVELVTRTAREPTGIAPSYNGERHRYPADEAALLAAVKRYDKHHGGDQTSALADSYAKTIDASATDKATGLPFSDLDNSATGKLPRGCALSWQTRYLAEVLPERARANWKRYRELYGVDTGLLVGLREWPPGVDKAADIDSGPIVQGVGAAATALAIAGARVMGDMLFAQRIEATDSMVVGLMSAKPKVAKQAHSILADAIRFVGSASVPE